MKTNKVTEDKREAFENMTEITFEKHQQKTKNVREIEKKIKEITRILNETIANQNIILGRLRVTLSRIKKTNIS